MICIGGERIKICDRAVEDCVDCVTGPRMRVPRLTDTALVDCALRSIPQLQELASICEGMIKLYENSKLGEANKRSLYSLLKRLTTLQRDMWNTDSAVYSNLLLNEGGNARPEGKDLFASKIDS